MRTHSEIIVEFGTRGITGAGNMVCLACPAEREVDDSLLRAYDQDSGERHAGEPRPNANALLETS